MKWHLRRIIWLLITCRTCFRHQTPLSTPNKQRIRPHLYTGLQHTGVAPWNPSWPGGFGLQWLLCGGSIPPQPSSLTYLITITPVHTRWHWTWGRTGGAKFSRTTSSPLMKFSDEFYNNNDFIISILYFWMH